MELVIDITQTINAYPQWLQDYSAQPIQLSENVPVNYIVKVMFMKCYDAGKKKTNDIMTPTFGMLVRQIS